MFRVYRDGKPTKLTAQTRTSAVNKLRDAALNVAFAAHSVVQPYQDKTMLMVWDTYNDKQVAMFELVEE